MAKDDSLKQIKQFIKDRDWDKFHDPKNLAISLNLETAEVLELFQWTKDNNINPEKRDSLNDELADVYYWLLLLADYYKIDLDDNLNANDVADKLSQLAAEKVLDNIDDILEDKANFIEQDHSKATYASKIQKAEGEINWSNNAKDIIGKINGLYPVPGAFFIYKGERYKILKAEIGNGIGNPGEVVSNYLEVACGDSQSIKIKEIQREGKKVQNIGEFMLGSQIRKGIII